MANVKPKKTIRVVLDEGAKMPLRAHDTDAGFDLFSRDAKVIDPHGSAVFDTGVHIEIPPGYVGFLKSKSGLNVNHGLTSEGVIDCGYTGSIRVKLYNNSSEPYPILAGDKITQLVLLPVYTPRLWRAAKLKETNRGDGGFGSTGR